THTHTPINADRKNNMNDKETTNVGSWSFFMPKREGCDMLKSNENGRSMIEMLGVLAIVGVLSVGGIAGYGKAMQNFKINKLKDQIYTVSGNIMTTFVNEKNYGSLGITNATGISAAKGMKLIPADMIKEDGSVKHAFGGNFYVRAVSYNGVPYGAFTIVCEGLSQQVSLLLGMDAGFQRDMSFMNMKIAKSEE
ncbi:MAG: hypothetical protein IJZ30_03595, partial [Alphaproteobacteria bacterium]|nr:hypothetical protein [Alphaproteobacteria bacterium]